MTFNLSFPAQYNEMQSVYNKHLWPLKSVNAITYPNCCTRNWQIRLQIVRWYSGCCNPPPVKLNTRLSIYHVDCAVPV